jgi:hypothetical protein
MVFVFYLSLVYSGKGHSKTPTKDAGNKIRLTNIPEIHVKWLYFLLNGLQQAQPSP